MARTFFEDIAADGVFLDVRGEMARRSRPTERAAHHVGRVLTSAWVLAGMLVGAALWMLANSGWFPWPVWDAYPFAMLATIYSVLGPMLAVLILMRQYHDQQVSELTSEVELQVMLHAERKLTVALHLLEAQRRGTEPAVDPQMLEDLLKEIDHERLVETMRRRLEEDERRD